MIKMSDIAERAGVSVSTVSRALANCSSVSIEMREQIQEIAQSMGYQKRLELLMNSKYDSFAGVIIPDMLSDYYARFAHSAIEKFREKKLSVLVATSHFDPDEIVYAVKQLYKCKVKCFIIVIDDCHNVSQRLLAVLRETKLPVVFVTASYISDLGFDCIYIDEARGTVMAVEHLLHRGYSDIAFIGEEHTENRQEMFIKTLKRFNSPIRAELIRSGMERAELGGYLRMKEILSFQKLPDAVLASYDQMAIGAIHAIREAGLRIPKDIAIMGSNGIPMANYIEDGLTTITSPFDDMIDIAIRLLMKRMETPYGQPQEIAVKPIISVRATT